MFKKRHIDNHIEYLQGKRTYAETYEAPPKAHAYPEPCSRRGTLTTTLSTSRAREHMLKPMRLLLRHMPTLSHGMIPSTLTWSQRSSRISLGSHLETNHSLYSVALNVLNLSLSPTSSLSLEASCQKYRLEQKYE